MTVKIKVVKKGKVSEPSFKAKQRPEPTESLKTAVIEKNVSSWVTDYKQRKQDDEQKAMKLLAQSRNSRR